MGISRRKFLSLVGGMAVFGSSAISHASSNKSFKGYPKSFGVLHDTTLCIGCRKCEEACNKINSLPPPEKSFEDLDVLNSKRRTDSKAFTIVNRYVNRDSGSPIFIKNQCNHCLEPACVSACFVKALKKDKTGAVTYDASLCVGCRYCMVACPFNIPTYEYDEPLTPRVMKCNMCLPRIEKGLNPACVESCAREALAFGERDELIKIARERIYKYPEIYVDHIYGEQEMGGTNWLYLAEVPFTDIGMRDDLGDTPAPQLTAGPLAMVPMVIGLWPVLLTGIYAISKRKEEIAKKEKYDIIALTLAKSNEEMTMKLAKLNNKMTAEKEAAVKFAVKKALEEAKQQASNPKEEE